MRRMLTGTMVMLATTFGLAGCGSGGTTFDPSGPCVADGTIPGAYPELESRLPTTYRGEPPGLLDSGRNCSDEALGTLAGTFDEVRFAGATWTFGAERALVLAVFTAPGLGADAMREFYAASARDTPRMEILGETELTVSGRPAYRLDAKRVERLQTVVVWPSVDVDHVNVVITNDLPDPRIQEAIDALSDDEATSGQTPAASPASDGPAPRDAAWGPLAVVAPDDGSDSAASSGTLSITSECVFLESPAIGRTLLIWPVESTTWNRASGTITFDNVGAGEVVVRHGDRVVVGGSGGGTAESELKSRDMLQRLDWVAPPAPACLVDPWWSIGSVELQR